MILLAIDIGGTFTDLIAFDAQSAKIRHAKSLTTPDDPVTGVIDCIRKADLAVSDISQLIHGSTIAINTVIESKGAKLGLIVTRGTRDVYSIGRSNRPEAYNLFFHRPRPFVRRRHTFEVDERLYASGEVRVPLNRESVIAAAAALKEQGAEAVAICFLHSYANPGHEQTAGKIVQDALPDAFLSISHEILRAYREYERISTTVVNAYIGPKVGGYVRNLQSRLKSIGFNGELAIMQSNGGVMTPEVAVKRPVMMMESGPVGGIIASAEIGKPLGERYIAAFDMGGTTAKASLVMDGEPATAEGYYVGGYASGHPVMAPVVDVVEVGAGGGSIAWVDEVGALKVGPRSAGAEPGPIAYRRGGTEPTITDANVVLGRIGAKDFLGGEMQLDRDAAVAGLSERIAKPLELDVFDAARAVIAIAVSKMSLAVREVLDKKGHDPRDFTLVASGGAGPPHAIAVARDLHIPKVIIPIFPSHFSALGMVMTDERHDLVRTFYVDLDDADFSVLRKIFAEMRAEGTGHLENRKEVVYRYFFDIRYVGQEFTLTVPVAHEDLESSNRSTIRAAFDALHEKRYAHHAPKEHVEILNLRLMVLGRRAKLALPHLPKGKSVKERERRQVYFASSSPTDTPVYHRDTLPAGIEIEGPALINEYGSTTVIFAGDKLKVADTGELMITFRERIMAARKLDPVTLEVIRNALPAIANDMANGLARTSYNMMIYEIRDFCTALVNVKGELVSQNVGGVSHFVADLGVIITDGVKRYGADGFEPDDVVIMNHQAVAGQHLNNVVIYMPYFRDGELLMFTMVRAHWVDVGGMSTGFGAGARVTEPWIEGLQFDQLKIYNAGKPNEALIKMIGDNVRFREASLGDMRAQIAACKLAIRRLDELFDKFGGETVLAAIERIFDETEIKCRKVVSTIPDGVYEAESFYDGPEADLSSKVYFHAKVSVDRGSMTIDLSRSAKEQYKYGMNARTMAAARVAYKALTVPLDPVNEGSFRALDVIIPEGSVMMARFPAPMTSWAWLPTVIDTVITALVPAMPDRLPAAHYGLLSLPVVFFGTNPKTGKRFLLQGAEGGGWGGRPHEDGESVSVSICQGDVRNGSLEGMELKNPVVIEERSMRPDSGGAGKFRGGLASDLRVRNLADGMWNLTGDYRNGCPPWGVLKGGAGSTALYLLKKPGENEFMAARGHRFPAAADSEVIIRTGGGGGWGDPLERDPEMVREDVMEGLASTEAALRDYAVVIDPKDFSIDRMATEKLRQQRRQKQTTV